MRAERGDTRIHCPGVCAYGLICLTRTWCNPISICPVCKCVFIRAIWERPCEDIALPCKAVNLNKEAIQLYFRGRAPSAVVSRCVYIDTSLSYNTEIYRCTFCIHEALL